MVFGKRSARDKESEAMVINSKTKLFFSVGKVANKD